jgi:hypothetical protein
VGESSSFPKQVDGQSFESYLLFILIEEGSVFRRDSTDGLVGVIKSQWGRSRRTIQPTFKVKLD